MFDPVMRDHVAILTEKQVTQYLNTVRRELLS